MKMLYINKRIGALGLLLSVGIGSYFLLADKDNKTTQRLSNKSIENTSIQIVELKEKKIVSSESEVSVKSNFVTKKNVEIHADNQSLKTEKKEVRKLSDYYYKHKKSDKEMMVIRLQQSKRRDQIKKMKILREKYATKRELY